MFKFLINPESYSETIENVFDLSFVIKEGFCQMDIDCNSKQPVLSYISAVLRTKLCRLQNNNNGQCILKFNPQLFFNLINVYNIDHSQIERRDEQIIVDRSG